MKDCATSLFAFHANCPTGIVNKPVMETRYAARQKNRPCQIKIAVFRKNLPESLLLCDIPEHVRIFPVIYMGIGDFAGMMYFRRVDQGDSLMVEAFHASETNAGNGKAFPEFQRTGRRDNGDAGA